MCKRIALYTFSNRLIPLCGARTWVDALPAIGLTQLENQPSAPRRRQKFHGNRGQSIDIPGDAFSEANLG